MKILAIDPGNTTGIAILSVEEPGLTKFVLEQLMSKGTAHLDGARSDLYWLIRTEAPDGVVIEDYRIYADKAGMHIGQRILPIELISSIETICSLLTPRIPTSRMAASKKGKWPDARIQHWFPEMLTRCEDQHQLDALKLGLTFLEEVLER